MTGVIPAPTGGEFDYLLRELHHARRWRRMRHITTGFVALFAVACVLYGCAW
jgi:hypothetical protein